MHWNLGCYAPRIGCHAPRIAAFGCQALRVGCYALRIVTPVTVMPERLLRVLPDGVDGGGAARATHGRAVVEGPRLEALVPRRHRPHRPLVRGAALPDFGLGRARQDDEDDSDEPEDGGEDGEAQRPAHRALYRRKCGIKACVAPERK